MPDNKKTALGTPRTSEDLATFADDELVRSLAQLYTTLLERLNVHLVVGTGQDSEANPMPQAIKAGLALHAKLEALQNDYAYGRHSHEGAALTGWYWGLTHFEDALQRAAAEQTIGGDDDEAC